MWCFTLEEAGKETEQCVHDFSGREMIVTDAMMQYSFEMFFLNLMNVLTQLQHSREGIILGFWTAYCSCCYTL